nr:MAG TPA: Major capsid protein [Caudoviricetes sp.]
MATTKTIAAGLFKPELWSKELLRKINDAGVMLDCVNRDYEGEIKNAGDTVHIQKIGDVTVKDYSSKAIEYQELDGETDTLVINQKKYFAFKVDDIEKVQANIAYMQKYLNQAKKACLLVQDTFLLGKAADAATENQMGEVTLSKTNAYDTLIDLRTLLADAKAIDASGLGADGKRPYLIVNPKIGGIIRKCPEFTHATAIGDANIRKGSIGTFAGFDVKESTNLKEATSKTLIMAGTTEAITFASQIVKMDTLRDKDSFSDLVRGLYVYGAKTVQTTCLATASITVG